MKINFKYLILALLIFIVEVFIALYVHDGFIRPYVGDVLVILLLYALIKGVVRGPTKKLPFYLFVFAVIVEFTQLFNLLELLNLSNNKIAALVLGSSFDVKDIICYGIGALILMEWERLLRKDISYL